MKQALEDLPENFRLPVILADVEGFAYKEIAEMLDIPIGTVMSRLHRGRKAMQKALYDYAEARGLVAPGADRDDRTTTRRCRPATHIESDCNETLRELDAFLDGELTEETSATRSTSTSTGASTASQAFDFHAELKHGDRREVHATTRCRPGLLAQDRAVLQHRLRRRRRDRLSPAPGLRAGCGLCPDRGPGVSSADMLAAEHLALVDRSRSCAVASAAVVLVLVVGYLKRVTLAALPGWQASPREQDL